METGFRCIGFYPAQAGGYVVTLDRDRNTFEYPLKCWVLVEDENPDPEVDAPNQTMLGCFSIGGEIAGPDGSLNLVSQIGSRHFLPGEKFLEYKFTGSGID